MKYLGCAYYPEYWGLDRVPVDAALMKAASVNVVRIGEFAWARMEPEDGRFDLDWLHRTVEILDAHGINVLMCTPTATPPAWLTCSHLESRFMRADGRRLEHGTRRHYCYTSEIYRHFTRRIVEKLASEFSRHSNVVGWQIDNEPDFIETGFCYCENCQQAFQAWLKKRYGTLPELNRCWGTGFWCTDYSAWDQVRLAPPGLAPARVFDTRRFANAQMSDFLLMQADILKRLHPKSVVSTNLNGEVFTDLDFGNLFEKLDVAFKDLYFDICTMDVNSLIMDQFRSFKPGQSYWVTETGAGMCGNGRPAHKGQFNAWMWSNYAHGADAHVVFRWRTCLSGQEQNLEGMLEHSGHPGHRYQIIKEAFGDMRKLTAQLGTLPLPEAAVALIHDYDTMWGYKSANIGSQIGYERTFTEIHKQFYRRNVRVDVVSPQADLSRYSLVILPSLVMIKPEFAQRLKEFVAGGGVVLAQGQLGMRDDHNSYLSYDGPDHLQELFGLRIHGGMYLYSCVGPEETPSKPTDFKTRIGGQLDGQVVCGSASVWLGDLVGQGGKALLSVQEDLFEGQPAVVERATGKGLAVYAAAIRMDDDLTGALYEYVLNKAGVAFRRDVPLHVEIINRGPVVFAINHSGQPVELALNIRGTVLRGSFKDGKASLLPYDVVIVDTRV